MLHSMIELLIQRILYKHFKQNFKMLTVVYYEESIVDIQSRTAIRLKPYC